MNTSVTATLTRVLLDRAIELYRDNPRAMAMLRRQRARFDEPLRLAVIGPSRSGKSTVVRALSASGRSLRDITPVDTTAVEPDAAPREIRARCADADAVLCLLRRPRDTELDLARAVHEHPVAQATPINTVAVLSRADELGGGRADAVISARQIARRARREPELRALCQDVVAVAGQAANAGRTLNATEFGALRTLASEPTDRLEAHLLSVQRFTSTQVSLPVDAGTRERLLDRLGLFGVRLAVTLVRQGNDTQPTLAAQLAQRSGLAELRETIDVLFVTRAEILKARAAMLALDVLLRMEPRTGSDALLIELDRAVAGAHEFQELRLAASLLADPGLLPDGLREEAIRLIGEHGTEPEKRLGLHAPSGTQVQQALRDALRRWRLVAHSPELGSAAHSAALVVLRSIETIATGGAPAMPAYVR
ncbi:hypothetical protein [Haloechinothrix salitolerans]|uniref:Dynamin family protein n=1 Tax=Haloechinothrix salitolerans TaxID=926830 RepID=A0ABW2BUJ8_9PSEU